MTTTEPAIYQPGETISIHTDLFPSMVNPLPPGVPSGRMLRTIVTERALTVMWQAPQGHPLGRVDIPMTAEETAGATFSGGQVGEFKVTRAGGCGCRGKVVKAVKPFPQNPIQQVPRVAQGNRQRPYGVPATTRWDRKRS